eukprot:gene13361-17920_t
MVYIYSKGSSSSSCVEANNTTMSNVKIKKDDDFSTQNKLINAFTEQLSNVGCESHTYLNHIISNYEQLADVTYFTQGHPFDHAPDFLGLVEANVGHRYLCKFVFPMLFSSNSKATFDPQLTYCFKMHR